MKKVALVTDCSSGVGLVTAVQLAKAGLQVFAAMPNPDRAEALLDEAEAAGVLVEVLPLNLNNDASVQEAVANVIRTAGAIDVLVNNAGYGFYRSLEEASIAEIQDVMDLNFFGAVRCLKSVLPHMRSRGCGHILTLGAATGMREQGVNEIYRATKLALHGLIEGIAADMTANTDIQVTFLDRTGQNLGEVAEAISSCVLARMTKPVVTPIRPLLGK